MKKITVCHINVISVLKNTMVIFVFIGLIIGFLLGLSTTPANLESITLIKGLIKVTLLMGVYGLFASVVLALASVLYNLIFPLTGGLEVKIKEKE